MKSVVEWVQGEGLLRRQNVILCDKGNAADKSGTDDHQMMAPE